MKKALLLGLPLAFLASCGAGTSGSVSISASKSSSASPISSSSSISSSTSITDVTTDTAGTTNTADTTPEPLKHKHVEELIDGQSDVNYVTLFGNWVLNVASWLR